MAFTVFAHNEPIHCGQKQQLRQLRARINKVKNWIYSQPLTEAPTIGDMMNAVNAAQNMKSRWKKIADLQRAAKVLIFVRENGITSVERLADKVTELHQRQYDLAGSVKSKERRITKLNEHLAQVDIYNQHKAVHKKYYGAPPTLPLVMLCNKSY